MLLCRVLSLDPVSKAKVGLFGCQSIRPPELDIVEESHEPKGLARCFCNKGSLLDWLQHLSDGFYHLTCYFTK